jgi:hypothetical protein
MFTRIQFWLFRGGFCKYIPVSVCISFLGAKKKCSKSISQRPDGRIKNPCG